MTRKTKKTHTKRLTFCSGYHSVRLLCAFAFAFALACTAQAAAAEPTITLQVRDTEISEVIEMVARTHELNVLLSGSVSGAVSLSLYDAPINQALTAIANAAGYALEQQGPNYFIVPHDQVGLYQNGSLTKIRTFEINYADGAEVKALLDTHVSNYGQVNYIEQQNLLVVQDTPGFLKDIVYLVKQIDRPPRQVLIEARILEIALNDDENVGIDWSNLFQSDGGEGSFGVNAGGSGSSGFFLDLVTPNIEVALNALKDQGRVNTLSTPKLVALENQEASVVIGDRRGYQVTTTINQVTSESIEFLESGVILRVKVNIDDKGQVLMEVHPEVSTGTVDANGVPSQTTTEVTTKLLVPSAETVFIGGLMKQTESTTRRTVPGVNRIPGLRRLFSGRESNQLTTETIVLIRPVVIDNFHGDWNQMPQDVIENIEIIRPEMKSWTAEDDVEQATVRAAKTLIDDRVKASETNSPNPEGTSSSRSVRTPAGARQSESEASPSRNPPAQQPATAPKTPSNGLEQAVASLCPVEMGTLFCYPSHCACESDLNESKIAALGRE